MTCFPSKNVTSISSRQQVEASNGIATVPAEVQAGVSMVRAKVTPPATVAPNVYVAALIAASWGVERTRRICAIVFAFRRDTSAPYSAHLPAWSTSSIRKSDAKPGPLAAGAS